MYYKLDKDKNVIPSSIEEWSNFVEGKDNFPTNYRYVGDGIFNGIRISTVFIGLCVDFDRKTRLPNVFETIVFDKNDKGIYQRRYTTWEDAELGHEIALQWVKDGCKDDE